MGHSGHEIVNTPTVERWKLYPERVNYTQVSYCPFFGVGA